MEEHLIFLEGLKLYGKSWRKISETLPSRSVVQVRTHAQKYFLKLGQKSISPNNSNDNNDISYTGQVC